MKTLRITFLLTFVISFLSACSKEAPIVLDSYGKPEDNKSYTIMMYGCGGGNLDDFMRQNIDEAFLVGSSDRVKFTGQVNFSKSYQDKDEFKNTQRFIVGPEPGQPYHPTEVFDGLVDLSEPENLTEFIRWSKEKCPADEYILLLWNHGGGWLPKHDGPRDSDAQNVQTRGIMFDDNFENKCLRLDDIIKGIKDSGTKFKMLYFDACLMGTMEVIIGVKECADYFMGASHITPGLGGDYNSLMYHLGTKTNFEDSMREYCNETMSHWNITNMALDLKVINLNKIDKFLSDVKVFAGYLDEMTDISKQYFIDNEEGKYDDSDSTSRRLVVETLAYAVNACYKYSTTTTGDNKDRPFFDLINLAEHLTNYPRYHIYSAKSVDIAGRLNRSWNEAVVCNKSSTIASKMNLSVAVTLVNDTNWEEKGYSGTYDKLLFNDLTNWGQWQAKNPFAPENNPNPSNFNPSIPQAEVENVEYEFTIEVDDPVVINPQDPYFNLVDEGTLE